MCQETVASADAKTVQLLLVQVKVLILMDDHRPIAAGVRPDGY